MNTTLRNDILTETYYDMEKLVYDTAWSHWRYYGGDIDELIAQSNLLFIEAFDTHDSSKGELSTWTVIYISRQLKNYRRKERQQLHPSIDTLERSQEPEAQRSLLVSDLLDELTADALTIVQMFMETPREIINEVMKSNNKGFNFQRYSRRRLRNRLRQLGWKFRRITETFEEIKNKIR